MKLLTTLIILAVVLLPSPTQSTNGFWHPIIVVKNGKRGDSSEMILIWYERR